MFELHYRIVHSQYDDFKGQNGFFQIKCDEYYYGEIYPKELERVMNKVSLYDWFERLIKVIKNLTVREYVALSDVESYNTWIEFQRKNKEVVISIVKANKEQGTSDIEFELNGTVRREWENQTTSFNQLKNEILEKAREYIDYIVANNVEHIEINRIKREFEELI